MRHSVPKIPEGRYALKVVTRMTGLTADTIRAWERRYRAIVPSRTEGNTRRFSAADIRRLILLKEATRLGHSIKEMSLLSDDGVVEIIARSGGPAGLNVGGEDALVMGALHQIKDDYLTAITQYQLRRAADLLGRTGSLLGTSDFVRHVILPILRDTGTRWAEGKLNVTHEHLVSAQIRGLLVKLIDFSLPPPGARKMIFATPEGHLHEFGILTGALLAVGRGLEPIYLGVSVPEDDLISAVKATHSHYLFLSVVTRGRQYNWEKLAASLKRLSRVIEIWIGADAGHPLRALLKSVRYFDRFEEFEAACTQLET